MSTSWRRPPGRPLVIGHRGAPFVAPENSLESFRAAVAAGADGVEVDLLELPDGGLVVAHDLEAARAGAAPPAFDEVLTHFACEAPGVLLQVDLKGTRRLPEVVAALDRHGLTGRTLISSTRRFDLELLRAAGPGPARALGYPEDRHRLSGRRGGTPFVRLGLGALRLVAPLRVPRLVSPADAAVALHHRLISAGVVEPLHERGLLVLAWTVDGPDDLRRVVAAGVDGVITNDPLSAVATLSPTS